MLHLSFWTVVKIKYRLHLIKTGQISNLPANTQKEILKRLLEQVDKKILIDFVSEYLSRKIYKITRAELLRQRTFT